MGVAVEDFMAQRHPVFRHHQTDADLQAIGPTVAGVAPLGHRVGLAKALEVRAGHVVQEQLILQIEQVPQTPLEVLLQAVLVLEQPIQTGIQAIRIDLRGRDSQEILQRRAGVPVVFDVQFTRRLAEPSDRQNRRHRRPGNLFATVRHLLGQQGIEPQQAPQPQRQPHIPKVPQPLEANALEVDLYELLVRRILVRRGIEQRRLRTSLPLQTPTQLGPAASLRRFQFAHVRHQPLTGAPRRAVGLDQSPVAVRLAVLLADASS